MRFVQFCPFVVRDFVERRAHVVAVVRVAEFNEVEAVRLGVADAVDKYGQVAGNGAGVGLAGCGHGHGGVLR